MTNAQKLNAAREELALAQVELRKARGETVFAGMSAAVPKPAKPATPATPAKTGLPTAEEFMALGLEPAVTVSGAELVGKAKQFGPGSYGFNVNGKSAIRLADGRVLRLQVSGNLIVIGSKHAG